MVIDGGLGSELDARGYRIGGPLWSAEMLLKDPGAIRAVHDDYLAAGARCLETASYQLSAGGLRGIGLGEEEIARIFALSVRIAREAVAAFRERTGDGGEFLVAASLGPYGAAAADGSEYSGRYIDPKVLYAFHAERIRTVLATPPDVFLCETIPSKNEALAVASALRDCGAGPAWISFSCADGARTHAGDPIEECAAALEAFPNVAAVGVNCTAPDAIASLLVRLGSATRKALLACPNLGQEWDAQAREWFGGSGEEHFLSLVPQWIAAGASHIGGCCGTRPATIAGVARIVAATRGAAQDATVPRANRD
jgi:homocysteine S-methyltransferase